MKYPLNEIHVPELTKNSKSVMNFSDSRRSKEESCTLAICGKQRESSELKYDLN